jgi:hypothetical protein
LQSTPDQQNYQEQKKKREGKSKGYLRKTRVFCGEIIMYIKKGKESYEPTALHYSISQGRVTLADFLVDGLCFTDQTHQQ